MTGDRYAFVGDVHGDVRKLKAVLLNLSKLGLEQTIFLGDYVNRGPHSAQVLDLLSGLAIDRRYVFLQGNHDEAFAQALRGDMSRFIELGGARTVRSYIKPPVGPDVLAELRRAVPASHLDFLDRLQRVHVGEGVMAMHQLPEFADGGRYRVAGHRTIGALPLITETHALIDTGCGHAWGRLTALLWPSLRYIQIS